MLVAILPDVDSYEPPTLEPIGGVWTTTQGNNTDPGGGTA